MKKFVTLTFAISLYFLGNAQFNFNGWTSGATTGTIANGSCNMNVNISGSSWNTPTITGPTYDGTSGYNPTSGTGLALDHNWTNTTTTTTTTLSFSPAVSNPTFIIHDINRNGACGDLCANSWNDLVTVSGNTGTVTAVSSAPAQHVISGSGSSSATVSGALICNGTNPTVTFSFTGTISTITINYTSGVIDAKSSGFIGCTVPIPAACLTRVACTNPTRQYITIGSISTPSCFTAMPVEFGDFYYQCNDNALNLNWYTESELNNDKFQILASKDGLNFDLINEIAGAGTTQSLNNYNVKITNRDFETKYYKLRQIDYDGTMVDLKTIYVPLQCEDQSKSFSVFPNPTQHELNILNFGKENQVHIKVTNIEGKIIHQDEIESDLDILKINTSNWSKGMYFIEISNNEINEIYKIEKI